MPDLHARGATDFAIIAHRGFSSQAPENTLAAFDLAVAHSFKAIELDTQLTADGVPVVLHDGELQRVAGSHRAGPIGDLTAVEAGRIDVGSWFGPQHAAERIPRLVDVLLRYKGRTHLHVELKSTQPGLPGAVAAALRDCGWTGQAPALGASAADGLHAAAPFAVPGLTITSFHLSQLRASMQLLPGVRHGWLVQHIEESSLQAASHAGIHGLYPRANVAFADAVAAALAQGFSVRAWGVKTLELLQHVHSCGCQGATVDWPERARNALASNFE